MRKKLTLASVIFACLFSANLYAQTTQEITISVNGVAKINKKTDNSGITVVAKSYLVNSFDVFKVNQTTTTDVNGKYSFSFKIIVKACIDILGQPQCTDNLTNVAAIPLYITFTNNVLKDSINENIPLSIPFTNFTYTVSKTPLLDGYLPQIGVVTVDTAVGVNKNMIIWERKNDATIESYNILKASTINGQYSVIGNVLQTADYSVFRDPKTIPGNINDNVFYKIEAVYKDASKSPQSYPKAPFSLNVSLKDGKNANLSFINKNDIPLFDHGLYKSISIFRADGNSKKFNEFKKFDFATSESTALIEMLAGWTDQLDALSKYIYLVVGELNTSLYTDKSHMKSDSGPFSQSMSNLAESQLTLDNVIAELGLSAYPNPSNGIVTITVPEDGEILVLNSIGQTVSKVVVTKGISQIEIQSSGIYTILLKASNVYKTKVAVE